MDATALEILKRGIYKMAAKPDYYAKKYQALADEMDSKKKGILEASRAAIGSLQDYAQDAGMHIRTALGNELDARLQILRDNEYLYPDRDMFRKLLRSRKEEHSKKLRDEHQQLRQDMRVKTDAVRAQEAQKLKDLSSKMQAPLDAAKDRLQGGKELNKFRAKIPPAAAQLDHRYFELLGGIRIKPFEQAVTALKGSGSEFSRRAAGKMEGLLNAERSLIGKTRFGTAAALSLPLAAALYSAETEE